MTLVAFNATASMIALVVMLSLVMVTSSAPRQMRIGITVATSVVIASFTMNIMVMVGESISNSAIEQYIGSLKVIALSWAAFDVARIAMRIGTLDPVSAANAAKGFLISVPALKTVWSAWASSVPVPCWAKSKTGELLAMNASYEARYGKNEHSYVGEIDLSVWDKSVADSYRVHDGLVISTHKPHVFTEPAPTWKDDRRSALFLKFPILDGHGKLVAIGGMEIGDNSGIEGVHKWNEDHHPRRRKTDREGQ
jgi:hypothetical protein